MSHGDSYDTFSGTALTHGDGTTCYRALRIDRDDLVRRQPRATATPTGTASAQLGDLGTAEVKIAEVLSRPEAVDLQVFIVEVEGEAEFVALADRSKTVVYPLEDAVLEVTDWGEPHQAASIQSLLDEISFSGGELHDAHAGDATRRTAADREQAGKHAHQPARRQRVSGGRGWVG